MVRFIGREAVITVGGPLPAPESGVVEALRNQKIRLAQG